MKVSVAGVVLVKSFEGFVGHPYRDAVGVWTIGYGHTEGVHQGSQPLTAAQAARLLQQDLDKRYAPAVNALRVSLSQHQFDALVSFVYNVGPGGVGADTGVGRALRARSWRAAADHLLDWDKAGGRVLEGLRRRRVAERAMFLAQDDPLHGFTDSERRWIREYDRLHKARQNADRQAALSRVMKQQRKRIWHIAKESGDWDTAQRATRYKALLARTA
ncbi:MAG TPA: lysozyme [Solirubrobacteraceae bacterium]|nr:lysozyme [Solirubrobacteraceae bacterium]